MIPHAPTPPEDSAHPAPSVPPSVESFAHFALQAHATCRDGAVVVDTIIENLGTGEKQRIADLGELPNYLQGWGDRSTAAHREASR